MRTCGDCVVCCVYLKIGPPLDKPGLTHCTHLKLSLPVVPDQLQYTGARCDGNCSAHASKPEECRGYACLWLQGHGADEDRPDRSLILADTIHKIVGAIECKQVAPGAADTAVGAACIQRMSASTGQVALVPSFQENRLERVVGLPWRL